MSDFFSSLFQHFKSKAKTQLFGVFAVWWVVFHNNYFIVLLLVDQSTIFGKTGLLKNEYLQLISGSYTEPGYWVKSAGPILMTYLTIWVLPRMLFNPAYSKEKDNEYDRQVIKFRHEKKVENLRAEQVEKETEVLVQKSKATTRQKAVQRQNPEVVWEDEYRKFDSMALSIRFDQLVESLYAHGGEIVVYGEYGDVEFRLDKEMLAYADANGLVNYDRSSRTVSLTDKGRFFIKRYQESH